MKLFLIASNFWCSIILIFLSNALVKSEKYKNTVLSTVFEDHLILPHILPSKPEELCTIIYQPNFIIATGQSYYVYQIQSLPEIIWDYKPDKYYTLVVLGAIQKEIHRPTTISVLTNDTEFAPRPPDQLWHQWVIVDIRKNNLNSGTVVQPFNVDSSIPQPNNTHKLVYTFAVFEQTKKLDLQIDDNLNSTKSFLERYFTPLSSYLKHFEGSVLIAGNFFYAVVKPDGLILDSSPVRNLILKAIKNRMVYKR